MGQLLDSYWLPMYAHLRYKGLAPEQAEDLIQDFMLEILDRRLLSNADPKRGKLRTLLLTALDRFAITQHRRTTAAKRSPERMSSLEDLQADRLAAAADSPAEAFDRAWCLDVLAQALTRMQRECEANAQAVRWRVFEQRILGPLLDETPLPAYHDVAQANGLVDGKAAMNQLVSAKRQFARQLRQVIREYITHDGSVAGTSAAPDPPGHVATPVSSDVEANDQLSELAVRQDIEREIKELRAILAKTRSVTSLSREISGGSEVSDHLKSDFWLRLTRRQASEAASLASMFQLGADAVHDSQWVDHFAEVMNTALRDLPGLEYEGPGTLRDLVLDPVPPVELLRRAKDWANVGRLGQDALLPSTLANGIYLLIVAAAFVHGGTRITGLRDTELKAGYDWLCEQPWFESEFHPLARRVVDSMDI